MNKLLLEYLEGEDYQHSLVKMEDIKTNLFPYKLVWNHSKDELISDYLNRVLIHPERWFDEVIPIISQFDYVQTISHSFIINYSDDMVKMTSSILESRLFPSIDEINKYLASSKSRFKKTCIKSINKVVLMSDDLKTNQITWQIKSSEFNIDPKIERDKKLDQILNI